MIWRPWSKIAELEHQLKLSLDRELRTSWKLSELRRDIWVLQDELDDLAERREALYRRVVEQDVKIKRYQQLRQHVRKDGRTKQAYLAEEAEANARALTRQKGVHYDSYRCAICNYYHVGNRREIDQ